MQDDAQLVIAARSGDFDALVDIYDRYGDRLYDFCSSVLRDPDAAAETVMSAFVLVSLDLYRLRRPAKLEAWLFAMTRDQLLYRRVPKGIPEHPNGNGLGAFPETSGDGEPPGASAVVWEAAAWLSERDRILLDLHVRQGLERRLLADALGISVAHANTLVGYLEARVERVLGSLLVARFARAACMSLDEVLEPWDGSVTSSWLRRITRHVDQCGVCTESRRDQPRALELLAEVPREPAPPELREDIFTSVDWLLSDEASATGDPFTWDEYDLEGQVEAEVEDGAAVEDDADGDLAGEAFDDAGATVAGRPAVLGGFGSEPADQPARLADRYAVAPPPVPMRRNGFPKSMYPQRRRWVLRGAAVLAILLAASMVTDFHGTRSSARAPLAAEAAKHTPVTAVTATTAAPTTTTTLGPDSRAPLIGGLATVYACVGPKQPSTPALATVGDDRGLKSVTLVVDHSVDGQSQHPMTTQDGLRYTADLGPFKSEGTVNWTVKAVDTSGNESSLPGPAVQDSQTC